MIGNLIAQNSKILKEVCGDAHKSSSNIPLNQQLTGECKTKPSLIG